MTILFILLGLITIHYVYFISQVYFGLRKLTRNEKHFQFNEKLSVIIPLRDEAKNVESLCKSLKNQSLAKEFYEIIFVNDNSNDETLVNLEAHQPTNSRILNLTGSKSESARKKKALIEGIKQSKNDIIIVTDADCYHNPSWLETMTKYFDDQTAVVAGPVDFETDGKFFSAFQRIEYAGLILTGAGLIGIGKPTICSAANLAYRKKVFEEVGGFDDQLNFTSGDDDMLIQKIALETTYKINFAYDKKALIKTQPKQKPEEFLEQRKRWASKSIFYRNNSLVVTIILLFLFYISLPLQLFGGIFLNSFLLISFLISFVNKIVVEYMVMNFGANSLYDRKMLRIFFIAEILQIPYIIYSAIGGLFGNFRWKGDKVKR
ncbi:MAG: glycosyltransferase [Melioribacteraceae bacterium]|nr:MAG: glycosyltransferase [Melioribacteraceae bacterium]